MVGGITIKAYYTMTTTNKNHNYYHELLLTPCYLMREKLHEDYEFITEYGIHTPLIIAQVAEHLTAYNEISMTGLFWRMRDFKD